jgi:hypothetical protein
MSIIETLNIFAADNIYTVLLNFFCIRVTSINVILYKL